jgi:hypothetical protein
MVPQRLAISLPCEGVLVNSSGMEHDIAIDIDKSSPTLEENLARSRVEVHMFPALNNHQDTEDALEAAGLARGSLLATLLKLSNGMILDGGWIRILGLTERACGRSLAGWNQDASWREAWGDGLRGKLCFADDPLGNQYAINLGEDGRGNWHVCLGSVVDHSWKGLDCTFGQWLERVFAGKHVEWYDPDLLPTWRAAAEARGVEAGQCLRQRDGADTWDPEDLEVLPAAEVVGGAPPGR